MNLNRTSHENLGYVQCACTRYSDNGSSILNRLSVQLSLNQFAINVGDISCLSTVSVAMKKFVLCKRNLLTHELHLFVLHIVSLFSLKYISFVTASNGIWYCSLRCTACLLIWFDCIHFVCVWFNILIRIRPSVRINFLYLVRTVCFVICMQAKCNNKRTCFSDSYHLFHENRIKCSLHFSAKQTNKLLHNKVTHTRTDKTIPIIHFVCIVRFVQIFWFGFIFIPFSFHIFENSFFATQCSLQPDASDSDYFNSLFFRSSSEHELLKLSISKFIHWNVFLIPKHNIPCSLDTVCVKLSKWSMISSLSHFSICRIYQLKLLTINH